MRMKVLANMCRACRAARYLSGWRKLLMQIEGSCPPTPISLKFEVNFSSAHEYSHFGSFELLRSAFYLLDLGGDARISFKGTMQRSQLCCFVLVWRSVLVAEAKQAAFHSGCHQCIAWMQICDSFTQQGESKLSSRICTWMTKRRR